MKKSKSNLYHDHSMFKGAPPESFEKAKTLRNNMTPAEMKIWDILNKEEFRHYKFRRQHPINIYIVDFYSHPLKLIIEVDGEYHNLASQIEKDLERSEILKSHGLRIIRFTNDEVLNQIEKVKETILNSIQSRK